MPTDELAEINGIKPKKLLGDGYEVEVQSQTSKSVYKIKRTLDHYYCTCPSWRNQARVPVDARSCKHIRTLMGDAYEEARLAMKNTGGNTSKDNKKVPEEPKPALKTNKRKRNNDDEDMDEAEETKNGRRKPLAKGKKPTSKVSRKTRNNNEGEDNDNDTGTSVVPPLLLANPWKIDGGLDVTGWWMSEKLDGVRVFYDGMQMLSRLGNPFTPPKELLAKLPKDLTLDGELFGGRQNFSETVSIVKTRNSERWESITFEIFDVPSKGDLPFEDRMDFLETLFGPSGSHADSAFHVVEQTQVEDKDHVIKTLKNIESKGGEGLMLRRPRSIYEGKRSSSLLKLKSFYDAEARVTGYEPGKGRNKGTTGAIKCVMASGKTFNVGSGLSDRQRRNPPKVGSIIVYRFQELTRDGVPRFPTFIGESADKTEPKDADVPEHRKAGPDDV
ncbi:DNA ligase/mRNA capping enzyme [Hysterangium stoloniferum]|nr:DNA ligase/mRNA capping enzyme [Hysterangium stoloniferum]